MKKLKITIFTPSYNRKKELKALYNSLLKQDYSNFEWLIVDDGSVDDTQKYIKGLQKENKINIKYVYKENGGKQSAYNLGIEKTDGDIFLCIDSDDILIDNVLKTIADDFEKIWSDNNIGGVIYLQSYIKNKKEIIGTKFPEDNKLENYFDIYHKLGVTGDKLIVLKASVAKMYKFPMYKREKFVPEALIFNRISLKYKFKCRNYVAAAKEYLENGYSNNYFNLVKKNPLGNMLYFRELYDMEKNIYNIYGYILFGIYGKVKIKKMLQEHPNKMLILIMYIPVWCVAKIRK